MSAATRAVPPGAHPDRLRWNARYAGGFTPSFAPHPLAVRALALDLPDGPVADLACGPSGTALLAAAHGRPVTAVDVSELALELLGDEARRRGLDQLITLVHADLRAWPVRPAARLYARHRLLGPLWSSRRPWRWRPAACSAGRRSRPRPGSSGRSVPGWCLTPGEPATLLPASFTVLDQHDRPDRQGLMRRQLLARRQ